MRRLLGCVVALIAVLSFGLPPRLKAEPAEKRIALVIGNAAYRAGELRTSISIRNHCVGRFVTFWKKRRARGRIPSPLSI